AEEGEMVFEGPPTARLVDAGWMMPVLEGRPSVASIRYVIFTRSRRGGRDSYSAATVADVIGANATDIRRCAEGGAAPGQPGEPEPARCGLLFQAFDFQAVSEILLTSALPQVRGWVVARLARRTAPPEARGLLWRALGDDEPAIRLDA